MLVQQYEVNQNLGTNACKPGSDGLLRPFHSNMCLCFLAFVLTAHYLTAYMPKAACWLMHTCLAFRSWYCDTPFLHCSAFFSQL